MTWLAIGIFGALLVLFGEDAAPTEWDATAWHAYRKRQQGKP